MSAPNPNRLSQVLSQIHNVPGGAALGLLGTIASVTNVRQTRVLQADIGNSLSEHIAPLQQAVSELNALSHSLQATLNQQGGTLSQVLSAVQHSPSHSLPTQASALAMSIHAWLGQILVNLLDKEQLSPGNLHDNLSPFRLQANDAKSVWMKALDKVSLQVEGKPWSGRKVVEQCLWNPFEDPAHKADLAAYATDKPRAHKALSLLCAQRAALLSALMAQLHGQVNGDTGGDRPGYASDGWDPKKPPATKAPQ